MAVYDGRWYIAPSNVRIQGGGWTQERVPVDGFEVEPDDATSVVLRNDRFELTVFRRPVPGPRPAIGLTATWDATAEPRRARRGAGDPRCSLTFAGTRRSARVQDPWPSVRPSTRYRWAVTCTVEHAKAQVSARMPS